MRKLLSTLFILMMFLAFFFLMTPINAMTSINSGDLIKTTDNPAIYFIQGLYKRIFPHIAVYHSWGFPEDFSTVKTVSVAELSVYPDANPMIFRDGAFFRGTTASLGGKQASAVFYVENAKLRPIKSSQIYQALFNDPNWKRVVWVPDDLLSKFNYSMGSNIESSEIHPDGVVVKYSNTEQKYIIQDGKKRAISNIAFEANRYKESDVITIEDNKIYSDSASITDTETSLLTPGWIGNVESADWETYSNEELGISFKYSSIWKIYPQDFQKHKIIYIDNPEILSGDAEISITIKENVLVENILQEEKSLGCHNVISGNEQKTECTYCEIKESDILVDGYNGKELTKINKETQCAERDSCEDKCVDYGVKTVIFQKGNDVFILGTSSTRGYASIFDQLLATFIFLDES